MRVALLVIALAVPTLAQSGTCGGLTSVTDTVLPVFPPIARAAHVQGMVILMVEFKTTGKTGKVDVLSGPPMLQASAVAYVQGWRANEYTGPRNCPIVIQFEYADATCDAPSAADPTSVNRYDYQHVSLTVRGVMLCDPAAKASRRKHRFLFF